MSEFITSQVSFLFFFFTFISHCFMISKCIFQMLNFSNVDLCDLIQSQSPIVCISSSGQSSLGDRHIINELELSTCICISTNNSDTFYSSQYMSVSCRIVLIASLLPQRPWFSEVLQLLVSALIWLPCFPNLLTQAKRKFQHQNLPTLAFYAWELSRNQLEIKSFCKAL